LYPYLILRFGDPAEKVWRRLVVGAETAILMWSRPLISAKAAAGGKVEVGGVVVGEGKWGWKMMEP
jgi:hypothetical protein